MKFQNGAHLKKGHFLPTFHIFQSPGKSYQKFLQLIMSRSYTCILLTSFWLFLPYQFWKKKIRIYQVWFLFGVIPHHHNTNSSWLPQTSRNRFVNIDESHVTRHDLIFSLAYASRLTVDTYISNNNSVVFYWGLLKRPTSRPTCAVFR